MATRDEVLAAYPQFAWAWDHPEIGPKLQEGMEKGWDAARIISAIQTTGWWKQTAPAFREFQEKQQTDPAAFGQQLQQLEAKLNDFQKSSGANLTVKEIQDIAQQAVKFGWNDAQMQDAVIGRTIYSPGASTTATGSISTSMAQLRKQAEEYGVPIDEKTQFEWARQVAAGERRVEDFNPQFQEWAAGRYTWWGDKFKQGYTFQQLTSPYKQTLANELEMTPDQIDFNSPKWSKVIDFADPSSGERRAMTLSETLQFARGQNEYKTTRKGQQYAADLTTFLGEKMGKRAA